MSFAVLESPSCTPDLIHFSAVSIKIFVQILEVFHEIYSSTSTGVVCFTPVHICAATSKTWVCRSMRLRLHYLPACWICFTWSCNLFASNHYLSGQPVVPRAMYHIVLQYMAKWFLANSSDVALLSNSFSVSRTSFQGISVILVISMLNKYVYHKTVKGMNQRITVAEIQRAFPI